MIQFFLTGSRFFGTATEDSDWDYFTEDTPEARKVLEMEGYAEVYVRIVPGNLRSVYFHSVSRKHVQLVSNVALKTRIQNAMLRNGLGPALKHKGLARAIWKTCEELTGG